MATTCIDPSKIVVIDTETTGLNRSGNDEAVSLAMIDGNGNVLIDTLLKPMHRRSWVDAERINGISPDDVKDAPHLVDVIDNVKRYLDGADLVVGYNLEFDLGILGVFVYPSKQFDVMREFARFYGAKRNDGSRKWSKLTECASHYGYSFTPHGALEDCKATLFCYKAVKEDRAYLKVANKKPMGTGTSVAIGIASVAVIFVGIALCVAAFFHIFDGQFFAYIVGGCAVLAIGYALTKVA